jgi:hypothetical protein
MTPKAESAAESLLAQLGQARAELQRVELKSRTYLVRRGILDQTRLDLAVALRRIAAERDRASLKSDRAPWLVDVGQGSNLRPWD